MNKLFYPSVFHKAEEGGFWVSFPDFPECFTEGEDMAQAYEMAVEALGLALEDVLANKAAVPKASAIEDINAGDGFLVIVEFDVLEYQKKHNSKAVKKTLTIPEWLNEAAIKENINFSQVLQEALMARIKN